MKFDKRLLKFLSEARLPLFLTIFFGLSAGILTIGQAKYISMIIDDVFLKSISLSGVTDLLFIFAAISILRAFFVWFSQSEANRIALFIKTRLRNKLGEKIITAGPSYVIGERSGELSNTILNGVDALDAYFSKYIPQLFLSVLIPVAVLFFVFPADLLSGVVLLITAPIIPVFMILIGQMAESKTKRQWKSLSRMSAHFLDVLQGLTTLKLFGRSKDQSDTIARISKEFRLTTMSVLKIAFLSALVLEMAATLSTAIIAGEVGLRLLYAKMAFRDALFILILAPEFYQPLRQLGARFHAGMEGVTAAGRIFEILDTDTRQQHPVTSNETPIPTGISQTISFNHISFAYENGQRPVLKDISFDISPGERAAIVGPSGSGKTTIANLLLRFLSPAQGSVRYGGQDIHNFNIEKWRELIAYVPQSPYLFHKTIAENISLAKPGATRAEIMEAAGHSLLHDFARSLPMGYDTVIGEKGARLSGGQAQRIALARAFLKDAPILILDEPTSNLDPELENQIQESIRKLTLNKTTLYIAHRLTTVRQADHIFVMTNGEIHEFGSHDELMSQNGIYSRMIRTFDGAAV